MASNPVEEVQRHQSQNEAPNARDTEKDAGVFETDPIELKNQSNDESGQFQLGVQKVRAVTSLWSRQTLIIMFCLLYLVSFVDMLMTTVQDSLGPYIASAFQRHGLLATTSIVATILSGCSTLTIAKIVDIWGRVQGFIAMLILVLVSMVLKATAQNIETYVAANTLFWTGHIGIMYVVDIVASDITTLKNRMIIFGINGTPTIASTFAGPRIADLFYTNLNFRWAFGAFAIIFLGVCIPVLVILLLMQRKAEQQGLLHREKSNRNVFQSIWHYLIEFDVAGIIIITAAFALILIPFSIVVYAPDGWATDYIIAMEVVGVVCIPFFYFYEKKVAPVQFLPWKYLKEPTVIGSCLLYGIMFASVFTWNTYFGSYLQVVHRLNITTAGYVTNALSLSSSIIAPLIGLLISWTGDFKWTGYAGIPFTLLGTGLLIPFRSPDTHIGLVTLTQVLVGIGTGLFAATGQLAVMVPVSHQEIAVVLALWGMFGSIGASIGAAISGAIWNNVFPNELMKRLPEESKNQTFVIFGDLVTQMSYVDGTPEREAIVGAYSDVQRKMAIAGACFTPLILASIFIWKNTNIKEMEERNGAQTKGNVF